jgi:hypothetical protein
VNVCKRTLWGYIPYEIFDCDVATTTKIAPQQSSKSSASFIKMLGYIPMRISSARSWCTLEGCSGALEIPVLWTGQTLPNHGAIRSSASRPSSSSSSCTSPSSSSSFRHDRPHLAHRPHFTLRHHLRQLAAFLVSLQKPILIPQLS